LYQVAGATASPGTISLLLLKRSSGFFIYDVLLSYHTKQLHNKKPLCLLYHGFLISTTTYLIFLFVHHLFLKCNPYIILHFKGLFIMDKYLDSFREMISLRGLTDHTLKAYCTYIRAYLDYLSRFLHKSPENASWQDMRDYIKWLQASRKISDRTINCAISQLRFFTVYVLHREWDDTQLPFRRFDDFLPYVPSRSEVTDCIASIPDLKEKTMFVLMYSSGLRLGEVCSLRYEDIDQRNMRIHIRHAKNRSDRYAILSNKALELLTSYWFECGKPKDWLFPADKMPGVPYSPTVFSNKFVKYKRVTIL